MSVVACHHVGHYQACHRQQSLDVGVNHDRPLIHIALVLLVHTNSQSGIVDEHVYRFPLVRDAVHRLSGSLLVAHVEGQCQHLRPLLGQLSLQRL